VNADCGMNFPAANIQVLGAEGKAQRV